MLVFLYEMVVGGGFLETNAAPSPSLFREGAAMWRALAGDLVSAGASVATVLDASLPAMGASDLRVNRVKTKAQHDEVLDRCFGEADLTILIAPECAESLLSLALRCESLGGRLGSSLPEFIRVAGDKHRLASLLSESRVPCPAGVLLSEGDVINRALPLPGVLKPNDGAGSDSVQLVMDWQSVDRPPRGDWRWEQYCPGRGCSVAFLCGPEASLSLPPMWQDLSDDGSFKYRGGRRMMDAKLAGRATDLARRALDALPATRGFVGVDLVLGEDATADVVIEVNPRLTTSYIGLRSIARNNLAVAMLDVATGVPTADVVFGPQDVAFLADGRIENCGQDRRPVS